MLYASSVPFLLLVLSGGALGAENELRIHNSDELISFSSNVNSGTSYSGTTVYLDSDIDFASSLSNQIQPIGKNTNNYFQGVFDGQGHIISNLTLDPSSQYVGLFGYSKGLVVKNLVMDSSCSVVSSQSHDCGYCYGVITSYCESCTIVSVVNMGSVTFVGYSEDSIYIGGIAGNLFDSSSVINCVNYGHVIHSGNNPSDTFIGGLVGLCG